MRIVGLALVPAAFGFAAPAFSQTILHEIDGNSPSYAGRWMAGGADLNGDGIPDLVVAGATNGPVCMRSYSGKSSVPMMTFATPAFAEPYFTTLDVAIVGDLNGDGVADVMIGIPMQQGDYQGFTPGTAALYSGADGATLKVYTNLIQSGLGTSVSRLGDTNGDGLDEFLISSGGTSGADSVTLYSGATRNALATVSGGWSYGTALAPAGDVDHDGYADFVAGLPVPNGSFANPSSVLIVSGRNGHTLRTLLGLPADMNGTSVDGGADVDGDGTPDVVAGAPATQVPISPNLAHVRLYSGATGNIIFDEVATAAHSRLGAAAAFVGDVDLDGIVDFAGGEPYDSTAAPNAGAVHIYSGATGAVLAEILGDAAHANFGFAVARAGDLNQDGRPDVLVGSAGFVPPTSFGRVLAVSLEAGIQQFGKGTAGCSGPHQINVSSAPKVGNAVFALTTDRAPANALGLAVITDVADVPGSDPFGVGIKLQVDLIASTEILALDAFSDAEGFAAVPLAIPNNPALLGLVRYAQTLWSWAPHCSPSPFSLSASPGLTITVQ